MSAGILSAGILGTGILGSGILGAGILGAGILGSGILGTRILGTRILGTGGGRSLSRGGRLLGWGLPGLSTLGTGWRAYPCQGLPRLGISHPIHRQFAIALKLSDRLLGSPVKLPLRGARIIALLLQQVLQLQHQRPRIPQGEGGEWGARAFRGWGRGRGLGQQPGILEFPRGDRLGAESSQGCPPTHHRQNAPQDLERSSWLGSPCLAEPER